MLISCNTNPLYPFRSIAHHLSLTKENGNPGLLVPVPLWERRGVPCMPRCHPSKSSHASSLVAPPPRGGSHRSDEALWASCRVMDKGSSCNNLRKWGSGIYVSRRRTHTCPCTRVWYDLGAVLLEGSCRKDLPHCDQASTATCA
jgi:hypothetical protein